MRVEHLPDSIEGQRIYLKRHEPRLAPTMFSYIDRDRERLRQFLPWVDSTLTVHDTQRWIEHCHSTWNGHEMYDFGLFRRDGDVYMGNIGVHNIAWEHERCEIGYWILGDFEGKGFMSEAVGLLEQQLFKMGFYRIEIRCSSLNERSSRVPKRCAYKLDGVLRDDMILNGKRRDTLVFGKLKSEQTSG